MFVLKHIRIFEEYIPGFGFREGATSSPAYPFINKDLLINKVSEGLNKGKIRFKFWNEENRTFSDICSVTAGCARILDTKFEKEPQIRNIKLEGIKFRKVQTNTVERVIYDFLLDLGYVEEYEYKQRFSHSKNILRSYELTDRLKNQFGDEIRSVLVDADDLGDVIDNLKKIREEFFDFQREDYEKWRLDLDMKKYNL